MAGRTSYNLEITVAIDDHMQEFFLFLFYFCTTFVKYRLLKETNYSDIQTHSFFFFKPLLKLAIWVDL